MIEKSDRSHAPASPKIARCLDKLRKRFGEQDKLITEENLSKTIESIKNQCARIPDQKLVPGKSMRLFANGAEVKEHSSKVQKVVEQIQDEWKQAAKKQKIE
jgi:hypothetical protein